MAAWHGWRMRERMVGRSYEDRQHDEAEKAASEKREAHLQRLEKEEDARKNRKRKKPERKSPRCLTQEEMLEIRAALAEGETQANVARFFKVRRETVVKIAKGESIP